MIDLARDVPALNIVLDHLGGPLGVGPFAGKRQEVFEAWRANMRVLAGLPNVVVKLGGLAMEVGGFGFHLRDVPPGSEELAETWRPYMETCIEAFGATRCMFESNFPVDKGMCSYAVLWNAFKRIAAGASPTEKAALFSGTAGAIATRAVSLQTVRRVRSAARIALGPAGLSKKTGDFGGCGCRIDSKEGAFLT